MDIFKHRTNLCMSEASALFTFTFRMLPPPPPHTHAPRATSACTSRWSKHPSNSPLVYECYHSWRVTEHAILRRFCASAPRQAKQSEGKWYLRVCNSLYSFLSSLFLFSCRTYSSSKLFLSLLSLTCISGSCSFLPEVRRVNYLRTPAAGVVPRLSDTLQHTQQDSTFKENISTAGSSFCSMITT
jgi:hypothetical protein